MIDPYPQSSYEYDVGALERQNPLPIGFYSVDLPNDKVPEFRRWQQGRSAVKVVKTNDNGEFSWLLFSVSAPTVWASGLGFPSIAKATDERPQAFEPTKDPLDQIADALPSPAAFAIPAYMTTVVGVGLALYLFRKDIFESGRKQISKLRNSRRRRD
jgi:hypothetical protein